MTNKEKRYVEKEYVKDPCGQEIRMSQTGEYTLPELILKEHPGLRESVAKTAFERIFDDVWDSVIDNSSEKTQWLGIADAILDLLGLKKEV